MIANLVVVAFCGLPLMQGSLRSHCTTSRVALAAINSEADPTNLRKGLLVSVDGVPFEVIDCLINQPKSGVKVKMQNLNSGATVFKTIESGARVEQLRTATFVYR